MRLSTVSVLLVAAVLVVHAPVLSAEDPPAIQAGSDAEIMALLIALDEHEVEAASTAEKKKVEGQVLDLAQTIHQDHAKSLKETKALGAKLGIKPQATPAVADLRAKGKDELGNLTPLNGTVFADAFVTAMIEGHRHALITLDGFMNTAQNEELKRHLSTARQHIAMHLQKAEDLKLKNKGAAS